MTSDVFLRNRWTKWIGTYGRNPPERVDDFAGIGSMTRAIERLIITYRRRQMGQPITVASRFLKEIGE